MFIGFISFINLFPVQALIFHNPFTFLNFLSSNNCNLKFSCTAGEATIIIRFVIPICCKYVLISSQIEIAEHVFPTPNP